MLEIASSVSSLQSRSFEIRQQTSFSPLGLLILGLTLLVSGLVCFVGVNRDPNRGPANRDAATKYPNGDPNRGPANRDPANRYPNRDPNRPTVPYPSCDVTFCSGARNDYKASLRSCVMNITKQEWADNDFTWDSSNPKYLTWPKEMDWRTLYSIQQYYSKINYLYANDPKVGRMDDKVWLSNSFGPNINISTSPVLFAMKSNEYWDTIPASAAKLYKAVQKCIDDHVAFVLKPAHLESGEGIFFFDDHGEFHGQIGHQAIFAKKVFQGFDRLSGNTSKLDFNDTVDLANFVASLGDGQAVEHLDDGKKVHGTDVFLRDIAKNQLVVKKIVDCMLLTEVVSADSPGILVELIRPQDELRIIIGLGMIWGHMKTWGGATGGQERFKYLGDEYNKVEDWSVEDYDAAMSLAKEVAIRSGVDLIRVDVCKFGDVVRSRYPTKYGMPDQTGLDDTAWNRQGVFLSEFTLITNHAFENLLMPSRHIYAQYFPKLVDFWHRPSNLEKLGYGPQSTNPSSDDVDDV